MVLEFARAQTQVRLPDSLREAAALAGLNNTSFIMGAGGDEAGSGHVDTGPSRMNLPLTQFMPDRYANVYRAVVSAEEAAKEKAAGSWCRRR